MEFQRLGKSGLKISKIVLGSMSYGDKRIIDWAIEDEDQVFELLKYAYDKGIRTWDTADMYSAGVSEELIGKFLKKFKISRSTIVLLTKVYFPVRRFDMDNSELGLINRQGLSRKHIMDAVDDSVARLGTYIDVYQIHRLDHDTDKEEIMSALNDVVKSGKVRYIGASSMRAVEFAQLQFIAEKHGWPKFISMQNLYNLIYREEEREMIPFCNETGVGLLPWSPNATGALARPFAQRKQTTRQQSKNWLEDFLLLGDQVGDEEIINRVEQVAKKRNVSMSTVALSWLISKGTCPIVGFNKKERIDEAINAVNFKLTDDDIKYLEETYQPHKIVGFS